MEGMQKDASKGHALFISETACSGGLKEAGDARCRSSESKHVSNTRTIKSGPRTAQRLSDSGLKCICRRQASPSRSPPRDSLRHTKGVNKQNNTGKYQVKVSGFLATSTEVDGPLAENCIGSNAGHQ